MCNSQISFFVVHQWSGGSTQRVSISQKYFTDQTSHITHTYSCVDIYMYTVSQKQQCIYMYTVTQKQQCSVSQKNFTDQTSYITHTYSCV